MGTRNIIQALRAFNQGPLNAAETSTHSSTAQSENHTSLLGNFPNPESLPQSMDALIKIHEISKIKLGLAQRGQLSEKVSIIFDEYIKTLSEPLETYASEEDLNNAFIDAVRKNNIEKVTKLLKEGANPNLKCYKDLQGVEAYVTPLIIAIGKSEEITTLLLKAGASPTQETSNYIMGILGSYVKQMVSPLYEAADLRTGIDKLHILLGIEKEELAQLIKESNLTTIQLFIQIRKYREEGIEYIPEAARKVNDLMNEMTKFSEAICHVNRFRTSLAEECKKHTPLSKDSFETFILEARKAALKLDENLSDLELSRNSDHPQIKGAMNYANNIIKYIFGGEEINTPPSLKFILTAKVIEAEISELGAKISYNEEIPDLIFVKNQLEQTDTKTSVNPEVIELVKHFIDLGFVGQKDLGTPILNYMEYKLAHPQKELLGEAADTL